MAIADHQSVKVLGVIPARLASTRLPRKVLRTLAGKPMLAWVYEAATACKMLDRVIIATDSEEVLAFAEQYQLPAMLTPSDCASGTDRVHAIARTVPAEIYVNIQGDEPLLQPSHFDALLRPFERPEVGVTTLSTPCTPDQIENPNAVKVVTAASGKALYFSRAAIPYDRDSVGGAGYRKHLGIYAYRHEVLERFPTLPPSRLEAIEKLEQLRFLENGIDVYVSETAHDTIGVDTEEDLVLAEAILKAKR